MWCRGSMEKKQIDGQINKRGGAAKSCVENSHIGTIMKRKGNLNENIYCTRSRKMRDSEGMSTRRMQLVECIRALERIAE